MYVIVGASGKTGRVAAEGLLARGKKVRVVARHADALKELEKKGAEVFVGDAGDSGAMMRAFQAAEAIYVMLPPNYAAQDMRAAQNQVADALVKAIEQSGVKHVVALSSIGAQHAEGTGPVKGLHDFEERLKRLKSVNILALRPTFFMENTLGNIPLIKQMGVNGGAVKAELPLPMIAAQDIGAYAAKRLIAMDFKGHSIQDLLGPRDITWNEITRIIGKAIDRPDLKYVQFSYEDTVRGMTAMGMPAPLAESFTELARAANEGLLTPVSPRNAESTTPTTYEAFAPEFAAAFQSNQ
jgi:uncharacterized protein YbjT (DUF2867 family)